MKQMRKEKMIKSMLVIGAGHAGAPTSIVLAFKNPETRFEVVDSDQDKVSRWNASFVVKDDRDEDDGLVFHEPGLGSLLRRVRGRNLHFYSNITDRNEAIDNGYDAIMICVNTPGTDSGAIDTSFLDKALDLIEQLIKVKKDKTIVIEKSTVPLGTAKKIKERLGSKCLVVSNPEFLSQGNAVKDLLEPDRIILGSDGTEEGRAAAEQVSNLYHWVPKEKRITLVSFAAELAKIGSNAFLAQRLSSINALSLICHSLEAGERGVQKQVGQGIGSDSRIGSSYLRHSLMGFGGSCLEKDVNYLVYLANALELEVVARYWQGVIEINAFMRLHLAREIERETQEGDLVSFWGISYKEDTSDARDSPALEIVRYLSSKGRRIRMYDRLFQTDAQLRLLTSELPSVRKDQFVLSAQGLFKGASALVTGTAVDVQEIDLARAKQEMEVALVFDSTGSFDKVERKGWKIIDC